MKFGKYLIQIRIPEWSEAYMNYKLLKIILSPFKIMSKLYIKTKFQEGGQQVMTLTTALPSDMQYLNEFRVLFEVLIVGEFEKINAFFQYKLMDFN